MTMTPLDCVASRGLLEARRAARANWDGFTLVELLVAISVFAVMAAVAYGGLLTVLEFTQELDGRLQALTRLQTALFMLRRDIEQAVVRSVRDEAGSPLPPFSGGAASGELLAFTRAGWRNPQGTKRSTLQRVAYRWQADALRRVSWSVLDRVENSGAVDVQLLEGLRGIRLRFLDEQREWHTAWPPEEAANAGLPRAVELVLNLEGRGELLRLFCLPTGELTERPEPRE